MGHYLYEAKTPQGKATVGDIDANDIAAARRILEAQGLEQIVFQTECFDAATAKSLFEELPDLEVAPVDQLAARRGGLAWYFLTVVKESGWLLAGLLAWNAWSLYQGWPFVWGDWLGFGLTAALLVFLVKLSLPVVVFNRLLEANAWARWNDVQQILKLLRRVGGAAKLAEHQFDYYGAKALIGLGQRDLAFAQWSRWEGDGSIAPELFIGLSASLHDYAREYDQAEARHRELTRLLPASSQAWIDIAALLAARGGREEEAEAALHEADLREQTPMASAFANFARGLLALDRGDAARAADLFVGAMKQFKGAGSNPLMQVFISIIQGGLATALMRLGQREQAERLWLAVLPMLQAQRCDHVIGRYAAASAGHPWRPVMAEMRPE